MKECRPVSHVLLSFFLFLSSISLPYSTVKALHLKLIHRDSIHSPLYPGNLTDNERMHRLYHHTQLRAQSYGGAGYSDEQIRPYVRPGTVKGNSYLVELTIGTPNRNSYFLIMDTGSDLLWLQCQPCISCWNQLTPIFDPRTSRTFATLPCNHPLCDLSRSEWRCIDNRYCHYGLLFLDGQRTKGPIATETLGFSSISGQTEFVRNLVFGCGRENVGFNGMLPQVAGVLGLGMRPTSLARQILGSRFSYCLPPVVNRALPHSLLRFGVDAVLQGPAVRTVPFVPTRRPRHYYLPLADVSIAGRRIGFAPGTFAIHENGENFPTGGFVIDSGCPSTTFMRGVPYTRIGDGFREYFSRYRLLAVRSNDYELCYRDLGGRFRAFPSMTLHFENGNELLIQPQHVVTKGDGGLFCVAIEVADGVSIFGAYQQHNYRFSYDIAGMRLSYAPADCILSG